MKGGNRVCRPSRIGSAEERQRARQEDAPQIDHPPPSRNDPTE